MGKRRTTALIVSFLSLQGIGAAPSSPDSKAGHAFFETKIRPALVAHCYECHSTDAEKIGGKLLLDSREGILTGGESGPALVTNKPADSLIIHALHWKDDLEMPPKEPLPPQVIRDFEEWIAMGAPDPRTGPKVELSGKTYEDGALWSFEPVKNPTLPAVADKSWPRDAIDHFTLAKMESLALSPARDAPAETLVRRLYFDLTGLPPTEADIALFRAERIMDENDAVEKLVDRLLASPQFGVRWGRHWLDVARYAESNGNDGLSRNPTFPHAWRYRDYVIDAFNGDVPYDRFLQEQIAGDLLPAESDAERDRQLIATGFLALGAKPAKAMNNNFEMDVVADQLDAIGSGVLGLSVACARCHDHKFDPIPTRDYYAMAGFFTSTETMWGLAGNEKLTAPPTDLHVLKAAPEVPPPPWWRESVLVLESNTGIPKAIPQPKWKAGTPLAMGVRDRKETADAKINLKGDARKLGEVVPRGFLTAYNEQIDSPPISKGTSGRLELAKWLTQSDHPHTPRVMVNRIWLHLFGRGIVNTPNDFGVYGERPTHPELLDHLATRFVEDGWSVKRLVRAIVLTRTYQLDSIGPEAAAKSDPENIWLTRHSRRRLDAEALRDAMLAVSGQLDRSPADGSIIRHRDILVNLASDGLHEPSRHRSIYLCYLRNSPPPELAAFDLPAFNKVLGKRESSTIPSQSLFLYNNPFVIEQSRHLTDLVLSSATEDGERVQTLYRLALNRTPDPEERYRAVELLDETKRETGSAELAWNSVCQALLCSNEFRYID
ncbi:MAG: PSD1 and planctomycete cytochrome C domain-containing protein [Verrucomicrobiales bacterium]|nr:PSD1 and planctomycete cytochrome C domain-containing protein [Verrucomicrobiales bacterium]